MHTNEQWRENSLLKFKIRGQNTIALRDGKRVERGVKNEQKSRKLFKLVSDDLDR
jgi:hypothetical protein